MQIITGGTHTDKRGTISFVNDFDLTAVKRMYCIEHPDTETFRAWQGHQKEQKWFFVTKGIFEIALVQPDNWQYPSKDLSVQLIRLSAKEPQVLHVPGGYANGFRALEPDSKLLVFSDFFVDESKLDDFRFDTGYWSLMKQ